MTGTLQPLLMLGCALFATIAIVMVLREWRRHRRRHPRFPIPSVPLDEFDDRFRLDSVGRVREGTVAFVPNPEHRIPATPSDLETYILAALAKGTRRLFEFGTCSGRTTYLWGLNSPSDARITTLTLPPEAPAMEYRDSMRRADIEHARSESSLQTFVYSDTPVQDKIQQLFQDSANLDTTPYRHQMDLVFVDGGHSYPYVKNDSLKALEMVAPGGLVVWHDYRGNRFEKTRGVYHYLNELSETRPLRLIRGTSLVVYRAPAEEGEPS